MGGVRGGGMGELLFTSIYISEKHCLFSGHMGVDVKHR